MHASQRTKNQTEDYLTESDGSGCETQETWWRGAMVKVFPAARPPLQVRSSLLALALAQDPSHKSRADRTRLGDTGLVLIGPSGMQVSEFGLNKKEGKEVRAGNTRMPGKIMTSGMGNHKVLFDSVCDAVHMLRFPLQYKLQVW
jgi:hypothetical protein